LHGFDRLALVGDFKGGVFFYFGFVVLLFVLFWFVALWKRLTN
jgi:hypothetical protein